MITYTTQAPIQTRPPRRLRYGRMRSGSGLLILQIVPASLVIRQPRVTGKGGSRGTDKIDEFECYDS